MAAGPCQIEILFAGADVLVEEGLGETYHLASVTDLDQAIAIANQYAEWRRTWVAPGLFIAACRASMVGPPVVSTSSNILMEGNNMGTGNDNRRDALFSGYLIRCMSLDRVYKGNRTYRGFPDKYIAYTLSGQEELNGYFTEFRTALLNKTTQLGLTLKALSKDPAVSFPKVVKDITVVANRITAIEAVGSGAQAGYEVGERITVTGAKGTWGSAVNGVYRITGKNLDVLDIYPQPSTPAGFIYIKGTARASLRVPTYPLIARAELVRFAGRQVGGKSSRQRGRKKTTV